MPSFLHVGCGPQRKAQTTPGFNRPEWTEVRLDIDAAVRPDIVADITDLSAIPDAAMDGLYSSHNIEHLEAHRVPVALAEFARVLKPTGFAVVRCPDLQAAAIALAAGRLHEPIYDSPDGPISALDIVYGHGKALAAGRGYMAHRTGFSLQTLADALVAAGFARVRSLRNRAGVELWAFATRYPASDAELEALAAEHMAQPSSPPA